MRFQKNIFAEKPLDYFITYCYFPSFQCEPFKNNIRNVLLLSGFRNTGKYF